MNLPQHEVYAIRFAHFAARTRKENFLGGDPHDGPMPFDYFVFAIRGPSGTIVVDTGFDAEVAKTRNREHLRCPSEGLKRIGIDVAKVDHVVLTHLHYDHCGNQHLFPAARFHLQEAEMRYVTGRCMCHRVLRTGYDPNDISTTLRKVFEDRLDYHDGDSELVPGVTLHRVGGHTDGQMVVRVATRSGFLVLASDAVAFYENFERELPFPWLFNVGAALDGFKRLRQLADRPELVIPGHDPNTMQRFPAVPGAEGIAVRLD